MSRTPCHHTLLLVALWTCLGHLAQAAVEDGVHSAVFVVQWTAYHPISHHDDLLSSALTGFNPHTWTSFRWGVSSSPVKFYWEHVRRENAATSRFPSDFSLVRFRAGQEGFCLDKRLVEPALQSLRASEEVIGVFPQSIINNELALMDFDIRKVEAKGKDERGGVGHVRECLSATTNCKERDAKGVDEVPNVLILSRAKTSRPSSSAYHFSIPEGDPGSRRGAHIWSVGRNQTPPWEVRRHPSSFAFSDQVSLHFELHCDAACKRRIMNTKMWEQILSHEGPTRHLFERSMSTGKSRTRALRSSPGKRFRRAGLEGKKLWEQGYTGQGVRVAIFDTGLDAGNSHFSNVVERINWTNENNLGDSVGHGTHVAGVVAGSDPACPGFAPDANLFIFRVFSNEQVSYTSWFLDAFNYAIFSGIQVINLSIGGPDYRDRPFVDKVQELNANNIILVSAVGNDGPLYGTQNNPSDQPDTIGVGALSGSANHVAAFQSRGMTTWELPGGYGRIKPDIIAAGQHVLGPKAGGGLGQCGGLSGTSVASPVVAGAITLLLSTVPWGRSENIVNPASIKQVLVESAGRLQKANIFEQGAGVLDVNGAHRLLTNYTPRASLLPPVLDMTDCPYMWPYCLQPLYHRSQPTMANVTIANGMGVTGRVSRVEWKPKGTEGKLLQVEVDYPDILWPWSGYLSVALRISKEGSGYEGVVSGDLQIQIQSDPCAGEVNPRSTDLSLQITVRVIPTPPREKRLLWDQFHSISYPSAYSPRDYLANEGDMLDRHGDHLHTNFKSLFQGLVAAGYYIEVLGSDWTCFDANQYGALLLIDSEDEFFIEEVDKLEEDIRNRGLSLVLFADWYSTEMMEQVRFLDDNTRIVWQPVTGGANVPAINDLLKRFGMALGGKVFDDIIHLPGTKVHMASGNAIARMPKGSLVVSSPQLRAPTFAGAPDPSRWPPHLHTDVAVVGVLDTNILPSLSRREKEESHINKAVHGATPVFVEPDGTHVSGPRQFNIFGEEAVTATVPHQLSSNTTRLRGKPRAEIDIFEKAQRAELEPGAESMGKEVPELGAADLGGRVFLFGDSSCADDAARAFVKGKNCMSMFFAAVEYACQGHFDKDLLGVAKVITRDEGYTDGNPLPERVKGNELFEYSRVLSESLESQEKRAGNCGQVRWKTVPVVLGVGVDDASFANPYTI